MEIQQLRHLLAAADSTNYAHAARRCFTSRQNIAHSIKAIESDLDVALFERKGNGMNLTPEGRQVVDMASEIVARVDSLQFMFAKPAIYDSTLSLAVSTNLFAGMPTGVDSLLMNHSDGLRIFELSCEDCYEFVCSEKANVAVVMCMERHFADCEAIEIRRSMSYALVNANSSLASLKCISVPDLVDQKLLLMSKPPFQYEPLFSQLSLQGVKHENVSVLPSTSTMIHIMKQHNEGNVGIVSRKFALTPPRGTIAIPFTDPQLDWRFYLLYKTNESNSNRVVDLIKDIRIAFDEGSMARSWQLEQ